MDLRIEYTLNRWRSKYIKDYKLMNQVRQDAGIINNIRDNKDSDYEKILIAAGNLGLWID
jgi:hypothetical protein